MQFNLYYLHFIMRMLLISGMIMFSLMEVLFANNVKAQVLKRRIDIDISKSSIPHVFKELEAQHIFIAYDANKYKLDSKEVSSKKFVGSTVAEVLEYVLKGTGIGFVATGSYITLEKKVVQQTGRIAGRILDDRGQPLSNASVTIVGRTVSVQSGIDGTYLLHTAAGKYTLEVRYLSYQTQRITGVEVSAGQRTVVDVAMVASTEKLAEAVVTTSFKKASVAGLYATQKNAATVTDGISAEQIARTPDNDMGQVLKRITGLTTVNNKNVIVRGMSDRYNQAMLDGVVIPSTSMNRRDFSFDIIPTEMVSSVVVNKTASPDMSSEFSGGQVSVNTLDIPDQNFTSIQIGTGGNSQTIGKDFNRLGQRHASEYFGFFDKSAKQPEGLLPWQWNQDAITLDAPPGTNNDPILDNWPLSTDRPDLKYNDLDAIAQSKRLHADALKPYQYKGRLNQNYRFAMGRVYTLENNMRFGFSASANVRNEQNIVEFNNVRGSGLDGGHHFIDSTGLGQNGAGHSYRFNSSSGLVANLGLQGDEFKVSFKNMYARTYADHYNEAIRLAYRDLTAPVVKEMYQLPEAMSLRQHQVNVEYRLPWSVKLEAMGAVNKIDQQILDERKLKYQLTTQVGDQAYFQTPNLLQLSGLANDALTKDSRMWTNIDETDYNWAFNFSKTLGRTSVVSTLVKAGYQGWRKSRSLDVFRMLPMTRSAKAGEQLPAIERPYDMLLDPSNIGSGTNQAYYYAENIGGRVYNGSMDSHAMYLMADQKLWSHLRLVYGLRAEYYSLSNRQDALAVRQGIAEGENSELLAYRNLVEEKNWRFLPSLNATYQLTNTMNVRASYAKTAIRPDFRETSFFGFFDNELDGYISGEQVVSTIVDNVDLRLEWYPSPGEIISLTGYYKYLDRPIELIEDPSLPNRGYYVFANMESAQNMGLEMEVRKNLTFISNTDWLSKLFVSANGTLLKSTVKVLGPWETVTEGGVTQRIQKKYPDQDRPLLGQSPWLLNLGLGYWGDVYGVTASYNARGYRTNLAAANLEAVEFELAPRQLDAQLYARFFNKKAELKLNMANILNEWTRFYQNSKITTPSANGELNGDNTYDKGDGDTFVYRRRDGRRFNISLTYNF